MILYVTSVGLAIIWYGPLRSGCNFLEIPFCVLKLTIKTNVPIFKSEAGVKRGFICSLMFCLCNNFLLLFGKFHCVFYLYLKSIRCVYWRLI